MNLDVLEEFRLLGINFMSNMSCLKKGLSCLWMLRRLKKFGASQSEMIDVYFKQKNSLAPMGVLAHRLRALAISLVPPSTRAEILEPLDNFSKYPPFPPKNRIVGGFGGSPNNFFGWNPNF
jgi:hypothetical protein